MKFVSVGLLSKGITAAKFGTWKPPASKFCKLSVPLIYTLTTPLLNDSAIILTILA